MPYWKCYYHIVWATHHRQASIEPSFKSVIYEEMDRIATVKECEIIAMNAVSDHVHIAIAMPPSVSIAEFVSHIKGGTSHAVNRRFQLEKRFRWQQGYGVMTFGQRQMSFVRAYIDNQEKHHADKNTNPYLEYIED